MQRKKRLSLFVTVLTVLSGLLGIAAPLFAASKEKVLYSFCSLNSCVDGSLPLAGLTIDTAGNLYGTTQTGGAYGWGTVFRLALGANGKWTETVLHSFNFNGEDGIEPAAEMIFDAAGDLYGTTEQGGTGCASIGCGTVFELTPSADGKWTEEVLYSFNGKDGYLPNGLIFDAAGNLYGTTPLGGNSGSGCGGQGCGVVFELSLGANGKWTEKVLHNFNGKDGALSYSGLVFDSTGTLYGVTQEGGAYACLPFGVTCGTVFQLIPGANGKWTEKVLHSFDGADGYWPIGGLIFDGGGNLYGTTYGGGAHVNAGTVFRLARGTEGKWTEKVLHSFKDGGKDGYASYAGLIFDGAGSLYGTTAFGGVYCCGIVFRLTPTSDGKWTKQTLRNFNGKDGSTPEAGLIFDAAGNLYGTTTYGGASGTGCSGSGCGTVFEIAP